MSMEQNQLTRDLYAAGYTREDHPSFVYWSDWQNFGYLFEALLKFTWETPCGLLVDGKSDLGRDLACCDASFQGIDYCPENDNPLLRCPYERKDCPHSISGFPVPLCPCHTTGKRYSYEQSAERVESERSERQHRQYMEITGGAYCACVVGGNGYDGGHVEVQYDVEQCIRCRCQNPVCVIRKQKRDLSRANIFYDVRRTWITRIGFLEEKKVQVTKGERVFPHPVARTDAEIWLEMKKAHFNPLWSSSVIDSPHLTPEDRRQTFFSKMHRRYGEYDYFEFHYDVENIRIAKSEQRDLLQDLRDVADGLEVVHAVDLKKEQAAKKRESRQRRREQKERRLNIIVNKELARVDQRAIDALGEKDIIFMFPRIVKAKSTTRLVLKRPKTETSIRKVWLPKTLAYILRDWHQKQDKLKEIMGDEYADYNLVLALETGRPCEDRVIGNQFERLKKSANLPNVVFHSLRHSSTTYKLKLNHGDIKATQGDTGHAQASMVTEVYAHILDEERKINAQKFEVAFYANPDMRRVEQELNPPKPEPVPDLNLQSLLAQLQENPELARQLKALLHAG